MNERVLTINGGSSSVKFAVHDADNLRRRGLYGHINRIGLPDAKLTFTDRAIK